MEEMERELQDEERTRRKLPQLELGFENGLIDAEQRRVREDARMERLAASRPNRRRRPMAEQRTKRSQNGSSCNSRGQMSAPEATERVRSELPQLLGHPVVATLMSG
jgi:hypothetical protein